jgi:hypothetical protein
VNSAFFGQGLFFAEQGNNALLSHNHGHQNIKKRRFIMNDQQPHQPEQSGKQVALGIIGFIVGTVILLFILKVLLF